VRDYLSKGTFEGAELVRKLIIAIGFYGGLRCAELVSLEFGDITCEDKPTLRLVVFVRRSKTDQEGEGATVYILGEEPSVPPCPVALFKLYIENFEGGQPEGRFFRQFRWGNYTAQAVGKTSVSKFVREAAASVGLEGRYTPHSLRAGMATAMAETGATAVELQKHGRWASSNVAVSYVHNTDSLKMEAARKVQGCAGAKGKAAEEGQGAVEDTKEEEGGEKKQFVGCNFHGCTLVFSDKRPWEKK